MVEGHDAPLRVPERLVRGDGDPRRGADGGVGSDVSRDKAGTERRAGAVPSPDHDGRPRSKAAVARGGPEETAGNGGGGHDLGQDAGLDLGGAEHLGRPCPGHLVPGVRTRGVGRVRAAAAGQPQREVVLGDEGAGRPCPARGLVVAQPHELGEAVRRVDGMPQELVATLDPDALGQRLGLACARVSAQMSAGRMASSCASTRTTPIIWPDIAIQATSSGRVPVSASSLRLAAQNARHHSAGSCSAVPPGPKAVA